MKISFLVTYYNQVQYVSSSIESILKIQKTDEWEILVGDDGSTDGTLDEIQKYIEKDPEHIFLYQMPRDINVKYDGVKRASANRLNLLRHATGQCFCVLDGDDLYSDEFFVSEAIDKFKDENISVVAFGYSHLINDKEDGCFLLPESGLLDKRKYIEKYYLPAGACVFRNHMDGARIDFIQKLGYFDDNNILLNNLNYGEIFSINKSIYLYRQTGESIFTSMDMIEKSVLNLQGQDVDMCLIDEAYKESLFIRNQISTYIVYVWKNKICKLLGDEKYNRYLKNTKDIENSLLYDFLCFDTLDNLRKKKINEMIRGIEKRMRKLTMIIRIKRMFGKV